GPLTFGPKGVLFTADPMTGSVYGLQLDTVGTVPGTAAVPGFTAKAAALLGTSADRIDVRDIAVDPRTHNTYVAVNRGQGPEAQPAVIRVNGAGTLDVIDLEKIRFSSAALPNPYKSDD